MFGKKREYLHRENSNSWPDWGFAGFAVLLAVLVCVLPACGPDKSKDESTDTADLDRTVIVPAFESPMPEDSNVIWCSTMQVAWNELKDDLFKGPIELKDAEDVAALMNNSRAKEEDLEPESYFAAGGRATAELIDRINKEMGEKFPQKAVPDFKADDEILAYAYLEILMDFENP